MNDAPGRWVPLWGLVALAAALLLTVLGLIGIYACEDHDAEWPVMTVKQAGYWIIGIVGFVGVQVIGYRAIGRWAYALFVLILVLLGLMVAAQYFPMEPFIPRRRDTYRWIVLGPASIQVSEYAKVAYLLALAAYLRFRTNYRSLLGLLGPFVLTLLPLGLILKEPDLGTSLLFLPTLFIMLFAAGAKIRHLLLIILLGAAAAPAFFYSPLTKEYQRDRIYAILRQNDDDRIWKRGPGYQLTQSKIALGSGGAFGEGFRHVAFFRHDLLPEEHNDFIFAVLGHQWGFFGCLGVLACYFLIILAGLVVASSTTDPLGRMIAVGVSALILTQTVINIGMTIGLMPITGMTLPFVSTGGNGLVSNYLAIGLLASVARRRPLDLAPKPFEFG